MTENRKRTLMLALAAAAIAALWGLSALLGNIDLIGYVKRLHGG